VPTLRFRDDSTFTIVQFTDTHFRNAEPADELTRGMMELVLDAERPDFVMLTGDVIAGGGCLDPEASWRYAVEPIEARRIPWAAVFGNHDDEGSLNRRQLMDVQRSFALCLSEPGPADVSGVGNYALPVLAANGSQTVAILYAIDSNAYSETQLDGYGWIRRDQIAWYLETSARFRAESGEPLPALVFFHIPLPEYDEVWDLHPCLGVKYENVCCPRINTGFFAAMHEAGDALGTFVGHDHVNDYEGTLHGIRLCYGRGSGFNTYGRSGFPKGCRVIRLEEGVRDFETWLRLDTGERVVQEAVHAPQGRVLSA
jgi:3',5'-cyclic AMP phosphodiesterase CpdA